MQPEENSVAYNDLPAMDKYALFQLATVMDGIQDSFNKFQFYRFFQVILQSLLLSPGSHFEVWI
jgi:isoleucyl-tRNA synthetase